MRISVSLQSSPWIWNGGPPFCGYTKITVKQCKNYGVFKKIAKFTANSRHQFTDTFYSQKNRSDEHFSLRK